MLHDGSAFGVMISGGDVLFDLTVSGTVVYCLIRMLLVFYSIRCSFYELYHNICYHCMIRVLCRTLFRFVSAVTFRMI